MAESETLPAWVDVGALEGLGADTPTARSAGGVPLVVVRRQDDSVVAYLDACPHRGVPLSETGRVLEDTLVCSVHFWRFTLPEGRQTHLPDICLQRWATRITPAGRVEVRAPSPL
jgi:phenylpropionate dioxygenase-like ring-hydroxylating dioxygenase large terminal subunit